MFVDVIIILIFLVSIVFSFKYNFVQLKFIEESKTALENKTSYVTFLMSLGAHIGAGNIVGVATALIYGGPGSLFWMIVCTIFTTIFSLIENTIALKNKVEIDNEYRGGSCYYILKGLKSKFIAIIFSICLVISSTIFFTPIQVNAISEATRSIVNVNNVLLFILLMMFSLFVIFRGTKKITSFIEKIVPVMTFLFLIVTVIIIIINFKVLPKVIYLIINDAFNFKSGLFGLIVGLKRSLFSNEAGLGTAPSINTMSSNAPTKQAYLQVLACFIDTVLMCSLLGIIILIYNIEVSKFSGADLSIYIFEHIFGVLGKYLGSFFLFTFAIATIVSGFYSGESNILFLSYIDNKKRVKIYKIIYKILFSIGLFIGVFFDTYNVWKLADYGLILLGSFNIIIIIILRKSFEAEIM